MFGAGFLDFFFNVLWFALLLAWIVLVVQVFFDIFRSDDLSGWGKALWCIFVMVLPFLGVFVYVIARGGGMAERRYRDVQAQDAVARAYIRDAAGTGGPGDQLEALARLKAAGELSDAEYEQAKAKVLNG